MKITLKPDWDISGQPPSKDKPQKVGHFAGRKQELSVLFNELLRREQGAILISGYRGVGKTSFVYKTLQNVFEHYANRKILAVLMNSNFLDEDKGKNSIIVNLIRRLYTASLDEELPDYLHQEIEILYKKAVSVEFKQVESIENNQRLTRETEFAKSLITEVDKIGITQAIWLTCFFIAAIFLIYPIPNTVDWINKAIPVLFAFPIPFFVSLTWQYRNTTKKSEQNTNSAQRLYTIDNSLSNLEFDLDKLHQRLRKEGIKTIYVLDELDKLEIKRVTEILRYFKNLFTLSFAIFIFIGSEELYEMGRPENRNEWHRPLEYTYFTSKYFLSRPTAEELLEFIDEITECVDSQENIQEYDKIKRSFILEAKCDYFDLVQTIKGNITGFSDIFPIIEKGIDEDTSRKAKMQQIISLLYNQKYFAHHPLKWTENELVLRTFYDAGSRLLSQSPGTEIIDKYTDGSFSLDILAHNDLHRYLCKLGILDFVREQITSGLREFDNSKRTPRIYTLTNFMPESIPQQLSFTSQLDEKLIDSIEQFYRIIANYWNIDATIQHTPTISVAKLKEDPLTYIHRINYWGSDVKYATSEIMEIYRRIIDSKTVLEREEIEKYLGTVSQATEKLRADSHIILAHLIRDAFPERRYVCSTLSQYSEPSPEKDWSEIVGDIVRLDVSNLLLISETTKRLILIFNSPIEWRVYDQDRRYDLPSHGKRVVGIINSDKYNLSRNRPFIGFAPHHDYSLAEIFRFVEYINKNHVNSPDDYDD